MIERRLVSFAREADTNRSGTLDRPNNSLKRMPEDLRHVKKQRIGRHRIYYTGHHTQCSYGIIHIKENKRSGVDDDDDRRFQDKLRQRLGEPQTHLLD